MAPHRNEPQMAAHLDESTAQSFLERTIGTLDDPATRLSGFWLLWTLLVTLRWLVALHSYSGMNTPPMFGDYEAQRHWMEITVNLPVSQWYFNSTQNDLLYWGLDYPPLTAYVSYFFGLFAAKMEPNLVELTTSRGYETASSKVFMRLSVLVCDIVVFIPAVYFLARFLYRHKSWGAKMSFIVIFLMQPGYLLIDHGHFQYNCVCLGLTTFAVVLIINDHEFLGSICYALALNFKQMTLYFAPAFGIYLLSKCLYRPYFLLHITKLAIAVVLTFAVLWLPFCLHTLEGENCASSIAQVLHRIFPFSRGLFEDKVANFWCVADLFLKVKRHFTPEQQMRLCTLSTFLGFLPSIVDLLRRKPTPLRFFLSLMNCSLAFFLFSFQVHEKTILLPLLPVSFLLGHISLLSAWFSIISTFSMYFLLAKDGLVLPYYLLQLLFISIGLLPFLSSRSYLSTSLSASSSTAPGYYSDGRPHWLLQMYIVLSLLGVVVLHVAHLIVTPPPRYPHIHDYLFAAYSCGHFLLALVYGTIWQWTVEEKEENNNKRKTE